MTASEIATWERDMAALAADPRTAGSANRPKHLVDLVLADAEPDSSSGEMTGVVSSDPRNFPPMPARFDDAAAVRRYVLAGNATFTICSKATGTRFTYRVRASEKRDAFFVSVLTGPSNEEDFEFLGTLFPRSARDAWHFVHGKKSRIGTDAPSAKALAWFVENLLRRGAVSLTMEFWHEGRCGRCARKLTVPESIQSGLGPECAGKVEA